MAKSKNQTPAVTTCDDHEVILPPTQLTKMKPGKSEADDDRVARAEAALAEIANEFSMWMNTECERLLEARRKVMTAGLNAGTREELFRAAHDIKGDAKILGFPHAGHVAESLCRLIEHTPELSRIPLALVEQHVDAVRAIIREASLQDAEKTASKLAARLRHVTDEFLEHENRDQLEYLDSLLAPPLAPDQTM